MLRDFGYKMSVSGAFAIAVHHGHMEIFKRIVALNKGQYKIESCMHIKTKYPEIYHLLQQHRVFDDNSMLIMENINDRIKQEHMCL